MGIWAAIAAVFLALAPAAALAQGAGGPQVGQVRSPILTIDPDRLLNETRFGQRMQADLRERIDALAAENERLRVELTAEERSLTERRPTMEVEAFRAEAEAFDARVQRIRSEQDAKQSALERAVEGDRGAFVNAVKPVLAQLMMESGAAVIVEQRSVVLSATIIDITDEAIAAIDAELGDGVAPDATDPAAGDTRSSPDEPVGRPAVSEDDGSPTDANPDPGAAPSRAGADGG